MVDRVEMGAQVAGGARVRTGVNIAPGLSRGPLTFRPHRKTSFLKRMKESVNNEDYAGLFTTCTHNIHMCVRLCLTRGLQQVDLCHCGAFTQVMAGGRRVLLYDELCTASWY